MDGIPKLNGSEGQGRMDGSLLGTAQKPYGELVTVAVQSARLPRVQRVSVPQTAPQEAPVQTSH